MFYEKFDSPFYTSGPVNPENFKGRENNVNLR